jgi:hypothetical protein
MIKKGYIEVFAKLAKQFYGTPNSQKLAMHSLVRLLASVEATDTVKVLADLEDFRFSFVVATALKHEDIELVCWAAFLLHEYAVKSRNIT